MNCNTYFIYVVALTEFQYCLAPTALHRILESQYYEWLDGFIMGAC